MPALFAQEAAPTATPKGQADVSPFGGGFPLLMIAGLALFWVVVVLPADRRRKKDQEKLIADLKPGTKVATAAGLVGTVVTANPGDDEITIRSADSKLKVLRSSVTRVVGDDAPAAAK